MISRADCEALDHADPLAGRRDLFDVPDGVVYLDGNSLGALPRATMAAVEHTIRREWGDGLIRSWNDASWMDLAAAAGEQAAPLVGAAPGSMVAVESTTIGLYKAIGAALALAPTGRRTVVTEIGNFPTDAHVLGALQRRGDIAVVAVGADRLIDTIDASTAAVVLTHVNYRTGAVLAMELINQAAQRHGAVTVWDLSHSAGALTVELASDMSDFAVGCGYKFLNGGPGAPALLYAAPRHHATMANVLPGWLGARDPFAMDEIHQPADGMAMFTSGTPPVLGLVALRAGLSTFDGVSMAALSVKSRALSELFIALVDERVDDARFCLVSPRDASHRASQVSYAHPESYGIVQALIARGVIGDFRPPDIARFGIAPSYLRFVDIYDAVDQLVEVIASGEFRRDEYAIRKAVT